MTSDCMDDRTTDSVSGRSGALGAESMEKNKAVGADNEAGVSPSPDVLLASCNAALDDCAELTDADIKLIASALKDVLTKDRSPYQACFELQQRQVEELVLALMWCKPRLKHEAYQRHIEWTLTKYPKPLKAQEPRIVRSGTVECCANCEQRVSEFKKTGCPISSPTCPLFKRAEREETDFCQSDPRGPGRTGGE